MCAQFKLTRVEAEQILDEVASWENELREIYREELTSDDYVLVGKALDKNRLL